MDYFDRFGINGTIVRRSRNENKSCDDWKINSPISIRGFHHVNFENKGIILHYDRGKKLSYTTSQFRIRLADVQEDYTILEFVSTPIDKQTQLTANIKNFPTKRIQKHLEFYRRTTILIIK